MLVSLKTKKNVFNLKHFSKVHAFPHEPFFPKHHVFSKRVMPSFLKMVFKDKYACIYMYMHILMSMYLNICTHMIQKKYMYTHDTNTFFRSSSFFF